MKNGKITFGLIVGTRGCFNAKLATEGREQLIQKMEKMGHDYVILAKDATPTGAVEGRDDGVKCARLFSDNRETIDGIIVVLPNFSDELGIVNAINGAKLDVPVLLQASDDYLDKLATDQRRDSFCGKISVANNFYQYGIKFTYTQLHSCAIDSDEFTADIERFVKVCRTHGGLKNARIGSIGARPGDFQTMRISEKLLQKSGITVVTVDLSEIIFAAEKMDAKAGEVQTKLKEIKEYGRIISSATDTQLIRQAKLGTVLDQWIAKNDVQAAGIQCWTTLEQNYGCAVCLSMSMMGDKLIPCACETDVAGVVSMYALRLATGNAPALLDWNNNYANDRNKCVCTHCGNFPRSFTYGKESADKPEVSYLDILSTTLGKENCFGAVKGKVKAGDMTYFRISTDDTEGRIKAYLGEGEFTDDPFPMSGGIAVCKVPRLQDFMKFLIRNGFEHHVGMVREHCADIIEEVADNYLGWDLYRHE